MMTMMITMIVLMVVVVVIIDDNHDDDMSTTADVGDKECAADLVELAKLIATKDETAEEFRTGVSSHILALGGCVCECLFVRVLRENVHTHAVLCAR